MKLKQILWLLIIILILGASGAIYQYVGTKIGEGKYPPSGKFVDIGGSRLYIYCTGNPHTKKPTVIFDSGLGYDSSEWSLVQPEVAKFAYVCSYDRAGYGRSDENSNPRTSKEIVTELHSLLVNAKISPPYILVGHSFGGVNMQIYAKEYAREVVGLILVESGHEKLPAEPEKTWMEKYFPSYQFNLFITRFGISRLLAHNCNIKQMKAAYQENLHFKENLDELASVHPNFGNIPLIVIAAGKVPAQEYFQKFHVAWMWLQRDLATRSTRGKLIIAENSDHMVPLHQPEIIVEAVREMVR